MAQSVLLGLGPAELALVNGAQSAVAMVVSGQTVAAVEGGRSTAVRLVADDPGLAAVGAPSKTLVAVAVSDVLPKPTALGLATVSLSPSLEMVVPAINIF